MNESEQEAPPIKRARLDANLLADAAVSSSAEAGILAEASVDETIPTTAVVHVEVLLATKETSGEASSAFKQNVSQEKASSLTIKRKRVPRMLSILSGVSFSADTTTSTPTDLPKGSKRRSTRSCVSTAAHQVNPKTSVKMNSKPRRKPEKQSQQIQSQRKKGQSKADFAKTVLSTPVPAKGAVQAAPKYVPTAWGGSVRVSVQGVPNILFDPAEGSQQDAEQKVSVSSSNADVEKTSGSLVAGSESKVGVSESERPFASAEKAKMGRLVSSGSKEPVEAIDSNKAGSSSLIESSEPAADAFQLSNEAAMALENKVHEESKEAPIASTIGAPRSKSPIGEMAKISLVGQQLEIGAVGGRLEPTPRSAFVPVTAPAGPCVHVASITPDPEFALWHDISEQEMAAFVQDTLCSDAGVVAPKPQTLPDLWEAPERVLLERQESNTSIAFVIDNLETMSWEGNSTGGGDDEV